MSKIKIILIIFIAVLGGMLLFNSNASARDLIDLLVVEFQTTPLFNEGDIKPCDITQKWIKATNYSGEVLSVSIKATNFISPIPADDLSRVLEVTIKEGINTLYGPKALSNFYGDGSIFLSFLANGATVQYDIIISLSCDKGNEWQGKSTGFFNIEINGSGDNVSDGGIGGDGGSFSANATSGGGGGHLVVCGDNIRELGEECDDGNVVDGDGCSSICRIEQVAGASIEQQGEVAGASIIRTGLPETGGIFDKIAKTAGFSSFKSNEFKIDLLIAAGLIFIWIVLFLIRKLALKQK